MGEKMDNLLSGLGKFGLDENMTSNIFADEGAAVFEMFSRLGQEDSEWVKDEYFKKVISAAKAQMLQYPKYLKMEKQGNLDEFSESEQAVMKLLVLGEKNSEIAARLCVSENTVKYHLKKQRC